MKYFNSYVSVLSLGQSCPALNALPTSPRLFPFEERHQAETHPIPSHPSHEHVSTATSTPGLCAIRLHGSYNRHLPWPCPPPRVNTTKKAGPAMSKEECVHLQHRPSTKLHLRPDPIPVGLRRRAYTQGSLPGES